MFIIVNSMIKGTELSRKCPFELMSRLSQLKLLLIITESIDFTLENEEQNPETYESEFYFARVRYRDDTCYR